MNTTHLTLYVLCIIESAPPDDISHRSPLMCPASCAVLELQPRTAADLQWLEDSQCQSLNDWVGVGHPYQALCQRNKVRCSY